VTRDSHRESFAAALDRAVVERDAESAAPLSVEQRRLWLLGAMASGSWAVVTGRYRIPAVPEVSRLQRRMAALVARHPALRTVFVEVAGRPVSLVLPVGDVAMRVVDVPASPAGRPPADQLVRHAAAADFPLGHGPLLRASLLRFGDGSPAELVLAGHRLVLDETSLDRLAAGMLSEAEPAAAGDRLWRVLDEQRTRLAAGDLDDQVAAWGRRLARPAATEIPSFRPRPAVKGHDTASTLVELPPGLAARCGHAGDWQVMVTTAWLVVLLRSQAAGAAVCGVRTPRNESLSEVVGPLDPLRLVRVDDAADRRLDELMSGVAGQLRESALDVPFAHLLQVQPPRRDVSRTPYVQTVVRAVDRRGAQDRRGQPWAPVPALAGTTEYDLELTAWLDRDSVRVQVDFDTGLYPGSRARELAAQLGAVLDALLPDGSPSTTASAPLHGAGDAERVLAAGRGVPAEDAALSLVDLVSIRADEIPRAVALRQGETELSYGQLWRDSQQLARVLVARGVRPGDRVAVWLHRRPAAVTAMLAVMSAGAAYVPVDATYPEERVRYLLSDSAPSLLLTDGAVDLLGDPGVPVLRLDELVEPTGQGKPRLPRVPADAPAYLIYTSGSTGLPKGVVVRHSSVVNNVRWRQRSWPLHEADRVLHNHSFSFDPAMWAVFWPLAAGASIVLAAEEELADPAAMLGVMRAAQVSVIGGVPSFLGLLLDHRDAASCTRVRLVLSGAEPLTDALLDRVATTWSAEVVNLYGPTEATIDATGYRIPGTAQRPAPVPIGRPVGNTGVYIVDSELRPVPDGVPGEILVGGAGLALGYHRRASLTAGRFLPDPFGGKGERLYRTGDLGRRLPDGDVQFLGRIDDQVKVRGYRIELTEIEAVLEAGPGVREAAVVALDAGTERARLAAAVVFARPAGAASLPTVEAVRAAMSTQLPEHLVPDTFTALDAVPRTPHGKIDRRALGERLVERPADPDAGSPPRTAPRTELERVVGEAFTQVLRTEPVDVHGDFFALGGTSMMLASLASLLSAGQDVEIPLHEFFRTPTVAGVAETIEVYRREGLAGVLGRRHAATLDADGILDDAVRPDGLPEADWSAPKRVFLTGATGYLGLHLLEQVLRRTTADVVCLCRARDEEHAHRRLREGLDLYEIEIDDQLHRVHCVVGDLGEPRLGLTGDQWTELAATVDVIYHSGALVNFVYPYSALKAPNVGGTQRVLELACDTRLKAVHHISTIDTLLATHSPRPFLENDAPLRSAVGVPAGYTGSKWVAEKVVDEARRRGIPVTIFRPGLILGHTRNGATQSIDYLLVALRGFLPMRILPDYPRIFDVVPVDYVAGAIVHISRRPEALGGFFHLFNPAPVPLRTFCGWIRNYGYEFDIVPFEESRRRALAVGPGHLLYPLVPLIKDAVAEPHRALDPLHLDEVEPERECAQTLRMLADGDLVCPPTTEADAHAVLDYLVRTDFMPAPSAVVPELR
jgi:amino acid adenylation domain-containing protein/thioester reductase-like protein